LVLTNNRFNQLNFLNILHQFLMIPQWMSPTEPFKNSPKSPFACLWQDEKAKGGLFI